MGRKALQAEEKMKLTGVRLPPDLFARLEAATGPNQQAAFIREAIEEKLARMVGKPSQGKSKGKSSVVALEDGTKVRVTVDVERID